MKRISVPAIVFFLLFSCSSRVQLNQKELDQTLPVDPGIKIGRLENGLRYYIRKNGKPEKEIEFRLIVKVGSLQETETQRGTAHFIEHMAFNGSKHFEKNDVIEFFQSTGQRFGPDLNATTQFDRTVYRFRVPADRPEIVEKGFLVLKDWASGISFNQEDVDSERKIIVEEWRLRKSVWERARRQFLPVLYNDSLHADRHPIGQIGIVETVTADQLKAFYHTWYRPELMAVAIVGDVSVEEMEKRIDETFSDLKNGPEAPTLQTHEIPLHENTKFKLVTDPEITQPAVWIYQKSKDRKIITERDFRDTLIENMYVLMINSRLFGKDTVSSSYKRANYERCSLTAFDACHVTKIQIEENRFKESIHEIIQESEKLKRYGIFESELERVKKTQLRYFKSGYLERKNLESEAYMNEILEHLFKGYTIVSAEDCYRLVEKYIPTITVNDVNALRSRFNVPANRVVGVFNNTGNSESVPDRSQVENLYKNVRFEKLEPYLDEVSDLPFFTEQIEKGRIVKETKYEKTGVVVWELSNGGKVVIKPTNFKEDEILIQLSAPGGISTIEKEHFRSAFLVSKVVMNSGIGPFSRTDLIKRLIFTSIKGSPYISDYDHGFWGRTSPDDLESLMQLIRLALTQPRFDEEVFREKKEDMIEEITNARKTAAWKYRQQIRAALYPDSEYAQLPVETDIIKLDAETSRRVLMEKFQNRGEFNLILVGNVDPKKLRPLIETYIASYPITAEPQTATDLGFYPQKGYRRIEIKENLEEKSVVNIMIGNSDRFDMKKAHQYQTLAQIIQIMINQEIREKLGLVYFGQAGWQFYQSPNPVSLSYFSFGCSPENTAKVEAELKKILARLKEEPVPQKTIDAVQNMQRQGLKHALVCNKHWKDRLRTMIVHKRDIEEIMDQDDLIEGLSSETVQEYARNLLDGENFFVAVLSPKED